MVVGSVTGAPTAQTVGVPFNILVNAVNTNGDLIASATPTVNFTSSDGAATLPANGTTALANGTAAVTVTFNSGGSQTLTVSDQANFLISPPPVPPVTVNKAAPLLRTAPTASSIYNGQSLSASVLSGGSCTNAEGAAVPGTFSFTSPGTIPPVGTTSESVKFTPSNTAGYNPITLSVNVTVVAQIQTFVSTTLTTGSNSPWTRSSRRHRHSSSDVGRRRRWWWRQCFDQRQLWRGRWWGRRRLHNFHLTLA